MRHISRLAPGHAETRAILTAPDLDLLSRARDGDRAAIESLLARHHPDLKRFARRVCRAEDAEDAVQHTMIQLATQVNSFRGVAKLTSWLFTILKRECRRLEARVRRLVIKDDFDDVLSDRRDLELLEAIESALVALEPALREVVLLRDVEQLTGPEVAAELGITLEAMKSRLHRARTALRHALEEPGRGWLTS